MTADHPHHELQHLVIHLKSVQEVVEDEEEMDEEWFEVYEDKGLVIFTTEQLEKLLHMIPAYHDYIIVPAPPGAPHVGG
jgi:hypothetical protein